MENDAPIELLEYVTKNGRNPFREWLLGLRDAKTRARVRARLNRVRLGNFGDSHSVGSGISELRMTFGSGYRVYYGRRGDSVVILLCGGDKATQRRDIVKAKQYWATYLKRQS